MTSTLGLAPLPRLTRLSARCAALGLLLAATMTAGCGAGAQSTCTSPISVREAPTTLEGAWRVLRWDEAFDGTLVFHDNQVQATSTGTTYRGRWDVRELSTGRMAMQIRMDEATVDSIRQVYATPTTLDLTLVFSSRDEVIALQADGAWTRWERIVVSAPPQAAPAATPATTQAPVTTAPAASTTQTAPTSASAPYNEDAL